MSTVFPSRDVVTTEEPLDTIPRFLDVRKKPVVVQAAQMPCGFSVKTPEGIMTGQAGDFLMRGVNGEYYPCSQDVFNKTYEVV